MAMEGADEGDLLDEVWKLTSKFYLDRSFGGNDWEKARKELFVNAHQPCRLLVWLVQGCLERVCML